MPGTAGGTQRFSTFTVRSATSCRLACFGALLAGDHHVGLEDGLLQRHLGVIELLVDLLQHPLGHHLAGVDVVLAVHQHLGLDDRHQPALHAQRRIARQRLRVGVDRGVARHVRADVVDGAPLGELGAQADVLLDALAQPVEAFGDRLAGTERQRLGALRRP